MLAQPHMMMTNPVLGMTNTVIAVLPVAPGVIIACTAAAINTYEPLVAHGGRAGRGARRAGGAGSGNAALGECRALLSDDDTLSAVLTDGGGEG